jgi:FkbM family methyltransferase
MNRAMPKTARRALRSLMPRPVRMHREAQYFRKFGEIELHIVRHLCRPDADSLDIGANEGCYIHFMRPHSRHVYAFEPVPWLANLLKSKFPRGVTIQNIALSDAHGTAALEIPATTDGLVTGLASLNPAALASYAERRKIEVPIAPLDDVYSGTPGFMKIDVEGHEEAVLDGAWETIARCYPRILVEIEEGVSPGGVERITRTFARLDYRGYFVRDRTITPIERFDRKSMQRPEDIAEHAGGVPRTRFGRYINNFLFFPPDEPDATFAHIRADLSRVEPV